MSRPLSRIIYLAGFALIVIGFVIIMFITFSSVTSTGLPRHVALVLMGIGFILAITAWIGALIRLAQLRRWGWFVAVLVTNIGMFVYLINGPDGPRK